MEPRQAESKKSPVHGNEKSSNRFQIVKLEERIAPRGPCRGSCAHYSPGHNK